MRWDFEATGTAWSVTTDDPLPTTVRHRVTDLVAEFETTWSRFRADSLVSRVARATTGGTYRLPPGSAPMLALYDRLHRLTSGRLDPLVGADLVRLGYDPGYTFVVHEPAEGDGDPLLVRASWAGTVTHDGDTLTVRMPVLIDVGAVGKGFLVDRVSDLLVAAGFGSHTVDGSGDLRVRGPRTVRVGLEDPDRPGHAVGTVDLHDGALCASATGRRAWGDGLHHILDALTGRPTEGTAASWVLARTCAEADGLATALFLAAPALLATELDFDFVLLRSDRSALTSRTFPGELYTAPAR